jgi:hypothetical protein
LSTVFYARYNPYNNPYNNPYDILFADSYSTTFLPESCHMTNLRTDFYLNDLNDHALRRLWVHQTHSKTLPPQYPVLNSDSVTDFYLDFNDLNDHAMRRLRVHQTHSKSYLLLRS